MRNINDDILDIFYTSEQIDERCRELAEEINVAYADKNPVFVGLLKGALPFLNNLLKYVTIPCEVDYLRASSYAGTESTGNVAITYKPHNLQNRHVIIVEDIVDTGATLYTVTRLLEENDHTESIEICTLLDKKERRKYSFFNPKYIGFPCPNEFVVGFGLDYDEQYRQLPYIGILKPEIYTK